MGEVLIKVDGVSKKFAKDLKKSLVYGLSDVFSGITRKKQDKSLRKDEFWAVKDISFEVRRGECLGLIGHNGAGKSTLLKILNGLIAPDEGSVTMYGKVGALIELGAGFNPILTGRENIYNNAAIIGFSKQEIAAKFDAIVAFAEIEEFIDMPVQNYSSGMKVRLGFAIAAQMEPDVLIIDEVLAVGDLGFILKCFKQIDKLLPHTAVIFVSHSMPMVSRVSNQIILMEKGSASYQGFDTSNGINLYYNSFLTNEESEVVFTDYSLDLKMACLEGVPKINTIYEIKWKDNIHLKCIIENKSLTKMPYISFAIYDKEQRGIAEVFPDKQLLTDIKPNTEIEIDFVLKNLNLSKGIYNITFTASEKFNSNVYYKIHKAITIQVNHERQIWTPFLIDSEIMYRE
jgi:lipopolysaccharide transport system ATP-binding protein